MANQSTKKKPSQTASKVKQTAKNVGNKAKTVAKNVGNKVKQTASNVKKATKKYVGELKVAYDAGYEAGYATASRLPKVPGAKAVASVGFGKGARAQQKDARAKEKSSTGRAATRAVQQRN